MGPFHRIIRLFLLLVTLGAVTEDTWLNASVQVDQALALRFFHLGYCAETDIPLKTRKTSEDQALILPGKLELCSDDQGKSSPSRETSIDDGLGSQYPLKKDSSGDQFLQFLHPLPEQTKAWSHSISVS